MKKNAGFSLIELLMVITIMILLLSLTTLNFNNIQHKTTLATTVEALVTDLNQQQIQAMVGDTEGRAAMDNYGVKFTTSGYALFYGTYSSSDTTNFLITFPASQQVATTFPSSQVIFRKGSGEVASFDSTKNTVTLKDTSTNEQKVITINRYGVITSIN